MFELTQGYRLHLVIRDATRATEREAKFHTPATYIEHSRDERVGVYLANASAETTSGAVKEVTYAVVDVKRHSGS